MNKQKDPKGCILIVEDEVIVGNDLKEVLTGLGYNVVGLARTGEDAIDKALQLRPDIILMDIMLKGKMNGVEAATKIKEQYKVPIIYLTAYSDDATLAKAKVTEPFGYIIKPFSEKELHSVIQMALYKHKIDKEKNVLSEKVIKLTKKIPLTDNEKKVFTRIVEMPQLNDIELSGDLDIKRSTITSIKNKLRRDQYYNEYKIPNFQMLGCELLTFMHIKLDPNTIARNEKNTMIQQFTQLPSQIHLISTERELIAIFVAKNLTEFKKEINEIIKTYDKFNFMEYVKFVYFSFEISEIRRLFDYGPLLNNILTTDDAETDIRTLSIRKNNGEKNANRDEQNHQTFPKLNPTKNLTENEKIIMYALVKFPDLNDTELAQRTKLPRPSISQTRRKLMTEGFLHAINVPNLIQLRSELVVYNHIIFDQKMTTDASDKIIKYFTNNDSNIFSIVEDNNLCLLSIHCDYSEYQSKLDDAIQFLTNNNLQLKEQDSSVLTIPQFKAFKLDFSELTKNLLGIQSEFDEVKVKNTPIESKEA